MVEPARARDDRLLGGKPGMDGNSFGDLLGGFHVGVLDINRADPEFVYFRERPQMSLFGRAQSSKSHIQYYK